MKIFDIFKRLSENNIRIVISKNILCDGFCDGFNAGHKCINWTYGRMLTLQRNLVEENSIKEKSKWKHDA